MAKSLKGKTILITAGPTREYMDPVRYLSNDSSGEMGFSVARACQKKKAKVVLVSGPTSLKPPSHVKTHFITTAVDMHRVVKKYLNRSHAFVSTAAVSDYRFALNTAKKIKKGKMFLKCTLKKNPDILAEAGKGKKKNKKLYLVGFALETHHLEREAKRKLKDKNLDLIIGNTPKTFGKKTIAPIWIEKGEKAKKYKNLTKNGCAKKIAQWITKKTN